MKNLLELLKEVEQKIKGNAETGINSVGYFSYRTVFVHENNSNFRALFSNADVLPIEQHTESELKESIFLFIKLKGEKSIDSSYVFHEIKYFFTRIFGCLVGGGYASHSDYVGFNITKEGTNYNVRISFDINEIFN